MGLLRLFGFGKKKEDASDDALTGTDTLSLKMEDTDIVVYGSNDATRCVNVRELLKKNNYAFRDVRVDDDLSTRGWLQRTTGDDGLPKVFIGVKCYGGFEDIHAMISDGTFQQALQGDLDESGDEEIEQLKEAMTPEAIIELLKRGEILTIDEGGSETDVWAEPFAKPPVIYYEGAPQPFEEIGQVVARILERMVAGEIEVTWKEED